MNKDGTERMVLQDMEKVWIYLCGEGVVWVVCLFFFAFLPP